ncbi:MAG: endo-1,4-beta-xylanase [Pirellulales bacterium]|nr:endo-1,4-beta-xylanase [Pirellulales bacterium]
MGVMRFSLPSPSPLGPGAAARAYFSGPDGIPWPSATRLVGSTLEVERSVTESGNFHIPWPVGGAGELVLSTSTLPERAEPYLIAVELARGKLNNVRNMAEDWQQIGLILPPGFGTELSETTRTFARAVTHQHDATLAQELASQVIVEAVGLGERLAGAYAEQALAARKRQAGRLATWLGAALGKTRPEQPGMQWYLGAFNAAAVTTLWREIEPSEGSFQWEVTDRQIGWCEQSKLKVVAGPLVSFDAQGLPDWCCLWEGDVDNLAAVVGQFVETVVKRYRGHVNLWHCAARIAEGVALDLSEEDRLRLAVRVIEIARHHDPETPVLLSFDQPWGEYLQRNGQELSPLHVADVLVRSELGIGGIGLELNVGYYPGGTQPRDALALHRLLDYWSSFGLPLYVWLTVPGGSGNDPLATTKAAMLAGTSGAPWSATTQAAWAERLVPSLLARPAVRGVFWNQWRDDEPHHWPHSGLVDASGRAKPALSSLAALRRRHLT